MFLFSPRLSSQMNLFQRLLDIRICFSSNRIMPSSSTPLAWALYCSNPSVPSRQIPFGNEIGGRRVFFGQIVAEP